MANHRFSSRKKELLFIVPNIVLAIILMVFYVINKEFGFPYSMIPSYFFSVIAATIVMFIIHPKIKSGEINRKSKSFKLVNVAMLLLTVLIVTLIIVFKF